MLNLYQCFLIRQRTTFFNIVFQKKLQSLLTEIAAVMLSIYLSTYLLRLLRISFFFQKNLFIQVHTSYCMPSGISIYTLIYVITKKYYDSKYHIQITKGQHMIIIFKNGYIYILASNRIQEWRRYKVPTIYLLYTRVKIQESCCQDI